MPAEVTITATAVCRTSVREGALDHLVLLSVSSLLMYERRSTDDVVPIIFLPSVGRVSYLSLYYLLLMEAQKCLAPSIDRDLGLACSITQRATVTPVPW